MLKRLGILYVTLFLFVFIGSTSNVYGAPNITAPNGVLMDYATGKVLFDHNAHEVTYPASTTKVMTAILVLENLDLDEVITIEDDLYVDGSSMYLLKGESFTVYELLQALMIRSANDVAEVFAVRISGSVEEFAKLMNERAKELGALNTHFTNPHGLPDKNHVTTAYDLALIGRHAMSIDIFRDIASTVRLNFEPTEFTPETRYYRNTNRFLWGTGGGNQILYNGRYTNIKYDIIDGVKTGYTGDAQSCLITSANKDDHRLIAVVLGAQGLNVYGDSRVLIDFGYDNFQLVSLIEENQLKLESPIKNGTEDTIALYTESPLNVVLPSSFDPSKITEEVIVDESLKAPILSGDILGKVIYSIEGKLLGEVNLIAQDTIDTKPFFKKIILPRNLIVILIVLFLLWQGFVIYVRLKKRRKRVYFGGGYATTYKIGKSLLKKK
ncbi:D-alanyl-D-alanine carboxypeptidase family protein [Natronincola ferrireducens]|uniref:serine-type D-Ala-D-Ala carboxypeptidase n=1 Tax=Natronincola ferrireducens TaxID=393762 RepID=A0A1G9CZT1_9FIRM|nr:D-alanyl-D-alanine carboxypeptidase family protein [Natronincola ferrireducens]SDK57129.1 D-alanyl-D-alanine carboxypeptidase (penicillin-binding protein 5/6) [Natronincola ferrireducens]